MSNLYNFDPPLPEFPRDRYQVLELLGEGGMGKVYRARDRHLNRQVALKFIRRDDPALARRLVLEAQFQAGIEHPNIRKVFEVGLLEGVPAIAMEYISGADLKERAPSLDLYERIRLVAQAARAIHAAHQQGFVHRDLKPQNIMVETSPDGVLEAVVMDFGLARPVQATNLTLTDTLVGSPYFMPPEQIVGGAPLDARSDVYGLGATLYAVVTGMPPFSISSEDSLPSSPTSMEGVLKDDSDPMLSRSQDRQPHVVEALRRVLDEDPVAPTAIDKTLPRDLETIILTCLEKEPTRRYASARLLAEDLDRFIRGEAILAQRGSLWYRLQKSYRRNKVVYWVGLVAVVSLMMLGTWGLHVNRRSARQAEIAQRYGAEAQQIGQYLRLAHMAPVHDRRPLVHWLRQRLSEIEQQTRALGSVAEAPGAYALGQGYLSLEEPERAVEYLDRAWKLGFRTPVVAEALGETYLQLYQKAQERLTDLAPAEAKSRRQEWIAKYRDPAMQFLRQSKGLPGMEAYRATELAFLENAEEETIRQARLTLKATPWLYEVLTLEAHMWSLRRARAMDPKEQQEYFFKELACYEEAAARAPSDPQILGSLATIYADHAEWEFSHRQAKAHATLEKAFRVAEQAMKVDPDSLFALHAMGNCRLVKATLAAGPGEPPDLAWLDQGVAMFTAALHAHPTTLEAVTRAVGALVLKSEALAARHQPKGDELARARRLAEGAVAHFPQDPRLVVMLASLDNSEGNDTEERGGDGRSMHRAALQRIEQALPRMGNPFVLEKSQISSLLMLGRASLGANDPKEAIVHLDRGLSLLLERWERMGDQVLRLEEVFMAIGARMDADYLLGNDPEPTAGRLETLLAQMDALNPGNPDVRLEQGRVHLFRARARVAQKQDPLPHLAQARERFEFLLSHPDMGRRPFGNMAQAAFYEMQHCLQQGGSPATPLREGLQFAETMLKRHPEHQRARALRAAFLLQKAQSSPRVQQIRVAQEAMPDLQLGAKSSHALRKDLSPYLQQAKGLLGLS